MKGILAVIFCALAPAALAAPAFDHRPIQAEVERDLGAGKTAELADRAFDAMFNRAADLLEEKGHVADAAALRSEWNGTYHGQLVGRMGDAGDHAPLSEWVAGWYSKIEAVLGVDVMEATHLRDIFVLNYTIPVVFDPHAASTWCAEELAAHPGDTCAAEYRRHFAGTKWVKGPDAYENDALHHGFAGVVVFWCVWAGCEAALWGTDGTLICSSAGSAAEFGTERFVAPKISDKLWVARNH